MKITVLGTGTSTGVPVPTCPCAVCNHVDPKNRRLRTSIYVELTASDRPHAVSSDPVPDNAPSVGILVDTTPDLRYQLLRTGINQVDAVLYTHHHADHIFGLDDLRIFNFRNRRSLPVYASEATGIELQRIFAYAFFEQLDYAGGPPPKLDLCKVESNKAMEVDGHAIIPLRALHGNMEVYGFRFGKFAYLTDCSHIPEETHELLVGVEMMILDGLRERPHPTHFNFTQAVSELERIGPSRAYLTHLSHDCEHSDANQILAGLTSLPVELAYDGLTLEL